MIGPIKVTTETGSVYNIDEYGFCRKMNGAGELVDTFKPWIMKPIPDHVETLGEIYELPEGEPVIGQRLYLCGRESWWISTRVVSIGE